MSHVNKDDRDGSKEASSHPPVVPTFGPVGGRVGMDDHDPSGYAQDVQGSTRTPHVRDEAHP